jgi:hypothetical protein
MSLTEWTESSVHAVPPSLKCKPTSSICCFKKKKKKVVFVAYLSLMSMLWLVTSWCSLWTIVSE